ncbi:MAG: TolC family protein [Melioribacteraceae bacterium]
MKRYLILFIVLLLALPVYAQKKLTLDEAISIALQKNTLLIKSKNNLLSSESQLKNAYGSLLPSLGASAGWSWNRIDDKGGQQVFYGGIVLPTQPSVTDNRSYNVGVSGNVTLFNGLANYATISGRKDNLKASEYNIAKLKQDIVFTTTDYFYIVLNAEELMNVREENVKYFKKLYETVQERNRLGSVTLADVYSAQVQLGNAELLLIQTQNIYESSKAALLNYLSLNVLEDYSLVDPFAAKKTLDTDSYMKDFNDIQAMVNAALDNRFDYKSLQLNLSAAESGITIAKSGLFPSLSGNYSYSTSAITTGDLFNRKVLNVSLSLNVPIFSNFSTENQIQFAQVNALNAKEDLIALGRQIKIEIKQTFLDLTAAKKSLDVAAKNVTAAEETRKINQERYNLGSATILDVLQASRDYQDALRNKINAGYDFYRQHDKLNNAIGRLEFSKYE